MDIIKTLEDEQLRENKFDFHVGDTVKVCLNPADIMQYWGEENGKV